MSVNAKDRRDGHDGRASRAARARYWASGSREAPVRSRGRGWISALGLRLSGRRDAVAAGIEILPVGKWVFWTVLLVLGSLELVSAAFDAAAWRIGVVVVGATVVTFAAHAAQRWFQPSSNRSGFSSTGARDSREAGLRVSPARREALVRLAGRLNEAALAGLVSAALWAAISLEWLLPGIDRLWLSRSVDAAVRSRGAQVRLAAVGYHEPSLVFLTGTETLLLGPDEAARFLMQGNGNLVLVNEETLPAFSMTTREAGLTVNEVWSGDGLHYSKGRWTRLRLFGRAPAGRALKMRGRPALTTRAWPRRW